VSKRPLAILLLALVLLGFSACGSSSNAAITVNGTSLSHDVFLKDLKAIAPSADVIFQFPAKGASKSAYSAEYVTGVANYELFDIVMTKELDKRGLTVAKTDIDQQRESLQQYSLTPGAETFFSEFFARLQILSTEPEFVVDGQPNADAVISALTENVKVTMSPRYGSWDAKTRAFVPPPGSKKTATSTTQTSV
jgi:hypothetical protein